MPLPFNHQHLRYFQAVATFGTIARASQELHVTPQTISAQMKILEDDLGAQLFERVGRRLVLTEMGQVVKRYAEEIFGLSRELAETVRGEGPGPGAILRVGVSDALPKLVGHHLLEPALRLDGESRIVCREEGMEQLLGELAIHRLDMVLSDTPLPRSFSVKAFNHSLGESGVTWMASSRFAKKLKRNFPQSLNGAPVLLPTSDSGLRRALDVWMDNEEIRPRIVGEFQDPALMEAFGQAGEGAFVVSDVVAREVASQFGAIKLGPARGVVQRFYAISVERRVKHPAVAAICDGARTLKHMRQ
jgi:LysR family transcriptional activator of nhaA